MFLAQALHSMLIMMPPRKKIINKNAKILLYFKQLTNRTLEMNSNKGTQIALGVFVRIIISWEATSGVVFDRSDVLQVCWILTLTRNPNCVQLKLWKLDFVKVKRVYSLTANGSLAAVSDMKDCKSCGMLPGKLPESL